MTLNASKGLAFLVVALVGAWCSPSEGEDECEEAWLTSVDDGTVGGKAR